MSYNVDRFPSVFLTADIVVKCDDRVLLIQRLNEPFKNCWALPGGFFDVLTDACISTAAVRELYEETNLQCRESQLKLLGVFSERHRDPREAIASKACRIISTAYLLEVNADDLVKMGQPTAKDDAKSLKWFSLSELPQLAFDHGKIIEAALRGVHA